MPDYQFKARDRQGKAVSGQRTAQNQEDLASQLINEGLVPVEITLGRAASAATRTKKMSWRWGKKVSHDTLSLFCRQMYTLLRSGIPVSTAISKLADTTDNEAFADILRKILVALNEGSSLHLAMSQCHNIFSDFFVNLITVGESTGNLDNIFLYLADYIEFEVDTRKKVKTATRYPIIVVFAILIALLIINVFVIPTFANFFASFDAELPLPTRILLASSNFIIHDWYLLLGSVLVTVFSLRAYLKTPSGQLRWGRLQLKIPVIGWLIHRIFLARFSRLFALVLRAGVTAVNGIQMVGAATNNTYLAQKISAVTDLIARGNTISLAIEKTELFPPLVVQMILVGQESGSIDSLLDQVASYYEKEIDYDIARLGEALEPILLVILGVMVLILALGVFLPMWSLAHVVMKK